MLNKGIKFLIENKLKALMKKLFKKDRSLYNAIMNKIEEILTCKEVNHYKNLSKPLQNFKRVRIKRSFVLTFKYIESEDKVIFYKFGHHDDIYS